MKKLNLKGLQLKNCLRKMKKGETDFVLITPKEVFINIDVESAAELALGYLNLCLNTRIITKEKLYEIVRKVKENEK